LKGVEGKLGRPMLGEKTKRISLMGTQGTRINLLAKKRGQAP